MTTAPFPLRRVIACARRLQARQGFGRRYAIAAAIKIVCRNANTPAPKARPADAEQGARLEHLQHRARSLRAWRPA